MAIKTFHVCTRSKLNTYTQPHVCIFFSFFCEILIISIIIILISIFMVFFHMIFQLSFYIVECYFGPFHVLAPSGVVHYNNID